MDLTSKGFRRGTVMEVLDFLLEEGYVDDGVFARDMVIRAQEENKGWTRIYAELRRRGIEGNLAEETLLNYYDVEKERESIFRLVCKHLGDRGKPMTRSEMEKTIRSISRRGFMPSSVNRQISEFIGERYGDGGSTFLDTNNRVS